MARQNINVNPAIREFEAYMDFSGGINTETSNERLLDNEFLQMKNVDLKNRGSVKKRTGYSFVADVPVVANVTPSNVQGMFFFYRKNQQHPDIIFARQGRLYVKQFSNNTTTATEIVISGMVDSSGTAVSQFQKERIVEGVQFLDKLYVATGTDLVVVEYKYTNNTWSAKAVVPHEPIAQELKFIGTNSLLGFVMQDTELTGSVTINSNFDAKGITFTQVSSQKVMRNGLKGDDIRIEGFIKHKTGYGGYQQSDNTYTFYYRKVDSKETKSKTVNVGSETTSVFYLPPNESYAVATDSLKVYVNNTEVLLGSGFTELSPTSFELVTPATPGTNVKYVWKVDWYKVPNLSNSEIGNPYINTTKYARTESFGEQNHFFIFRPLETGKYDIKFEVTFYDGNDSNKPYPNEYIFNDFEVKYTLGKNDIYEQKDGGIKSCNRIRLHYNRLFMFGDTEEPTQIYFSHLDNPAYFPAVNMFRFDTGKKEPITTVERVQNYLTVFTKTTIHTITGTSPDDFYINLINDSVGCIAERSAVLTNNAITFLSQEGVYVVKPASFKLDQLNVQRVDNKLKSEILKEENVCATAHDSQYYLCYPDEKIVYRYYYEQNSWVKDESDRLNFVQFLTYSGITYAVTQDGKLLKKDDTVYLDDTTTYDMVVETKYFDLSKSFNFKKLKKLYVLARGYDDFDSEYKVTVYADSAIVLEPEQGYVTIDENDYVVWVTNSNTDSIPDANITFHQASILGDWVLGDDILGGQELSVQKARVRGKCRRVKVKFVNSQNQEAEIFGFGLEFKLKKP